MCDLCGRKDKETAIPGTLEIKHGQISAHKHLNNAKSPTVLLVFPTFVSILVILLNK